MNEKQNIMQLPKDWKKKKLGDVCDLQNGFAFKSNDYINNSNTLIFRMSQIRPGGNLDLHIKATY
jgi:type I restriction enzyme S subunit